MSKRKADEDFSGYSLRDLVWRMGYIDIAMRYPHDLSRRELRRLEDLRRRLGAAAAPLIARIDLGFGDEGEK